MSIDSKTVLVTGASSGIGQSIARLLAEEGFRVFGTSREPASAVPIPGVEIAQLDVRSDQSVRTCLDGILRQVARIDTVVNNAGYVLTGAIEDASIEEARSQFETKFFGMARMVKAILPRMRQERSGRIINISSLAGLVPGPAFCGFYSASKHALEAYTEHLWREVQPFQIHVSLVEPGSIKTNLTDNRVVPIECLADYEPWRRRAVAALREFEREGPEPALVAKRVLHIIQSPSPKLRYRVGKDATWIPRLRKVLPPVLFEKGLRRVFRLDDESWPPNEAIEPTARRLR